MSGFSSKCVQKLKSGSQGEKNFFPSERSYIIKSGNLKNVNMLP
jgi:hypothetical protein